MGNPTDSILDKQRKIQQMPIQQGAYNATRSRPGVLDVVAGHLGLAQPQQVNQQQQIFDPRQQQMMGDQQLQQLQEAKRIFQGVREHENAQSRNSSLSQTRSSDAAWAEAFGARTPEQDARNAQGWGVRPGANGQIPQSVVGALAQRPESAKPGQVQGNYQSGNTDQWGLTVAPPIYNPDMSQQTGAQVSSTPYGDIALGDAHWGNASQGAGAPMGPQANALGQDASMFLGYGQTTANPGMSPTVGGQPTPRPGVNLGGMAGAFGVSAPQAQPTPGHNPAMTPLVMPPPPVMRPSLPFSPLTENQIFPQARKQKNPWEDPRIMPVRGTQIYGD